MTTETPPSFSALLMGVSHRPIEAKVIVKDLPQGSALLISRDYANQFDSNAIRVNHPISDLHLGFIAKQVAAEMAPWMDKGWHFTCTTSDRVSTYVMWLNMDPIVPAEKEELEFVETSAGGVDDDQDTAA